jgi:hypothetical protein
MWRESYGQELYGKANVDSGGLTASFAYYYLCVLILLYTCAHTTIYVSSYYYMCVLILLTIYVSSYK